MLSLFTEGCRGTAVARGALGVATLALAGSLGLAPAVQAQQCTYYSNYDSYRFTGAEASAPGFSCQVGDKTFTNFAGRAVTDDLQFELLSRGSKHVVEITSTLFDPGSSWDVSFDVTAVGPTISEISTYAGSNFTGRGDLNLMSMLTAGPAVAMYMEDFGMSPDPSMPAAITPQAQSLSLMAKLDVYSTSLANPDTWTQTITQTPIPPVPGPLPILGAGAAYGFSRQLRRRIAGRS